MRVAWFHCFAGIAGDMALASLIDAGADVYEVRAILDRLPVTGWSLDVTAVQRCGLGATRADVGVEETGIVRTHANISDLVRQAALPPRVQQRALATFASLAEAEGHIHRRDPSLVHFHEVGGMDAIVDVVGTCAALEVLGIDEIHASAVATGTGMVRATHGLLPNPTPAVVELLKGAPTYGRDVGVELTTPTGAALLAALAKGFGPLPAITIEANGFGAGTRDLDGLPNVTQVVVGTAAEATATDGQPVRLLEVNVDDVTGEVLAHTVVALLDAGAHDAWVTPILMKKGRPAYTVSALVDPALTAQIAGVLLAETGSLGVRGQVLERWPSLRSDEQVAVYDEPVRVKLSPGRVKVEYDDAAALARSSRTPLRQVISEAATAGRRLKLNDDDEARDAD